MSTYFQMWGSTIDAPDPEGYSKIEGVPIGKFSQGLPVIQGRESHACTWAVMSLADYHDLYGRWATNKATRGSFVTPPHGGDSWTSWRTVTAYCDPPTAEYRGNQVFNVSITLHIGTDLA